VSSFQWVWRYSCLKLARTDLTHLDFCLWGWMKSEVDTEKVNTRDELVARINSAALILQKMQEGLRRATRTIVKRYEKWIEVNCGIFEHLLWTVAIYWDIYITNKCKHVSLSFISFVRLFMRNIQTAVSPHT
jgi:hypothetical protein